MQNQNKDQRRKNSDWHILNNKMNKSVVIDGIHYISISQASRELKLPHYKIKILSGLQQKKGPIGKPGIPIIFEGANYKSILQAVKVTGIPEYQLRKQIGLPWNQQDYDLGRCKNALNRCYDKNCPGYDRYGGRGITMYQPWINDINLMVNYIKTLPHYGETFIAKSTGEELPLTIDRINNDEGYFPGNLKWSSREEQANNRRNSKQI